MTREEIAHRHGLPASFAKRLRGDTPEELEADAVALAGVRDTSRDPQTIEQLTARDWRKFQERRASDSDRVGQRLGVKP